ncbi:hypothetical protein A2943_02395 [Candidatus Adlerbacteria bacterium RIFCSPLOWO2_01_FULL_51_16]|uniref:Uncharacterized protein n=1 Tax=Candidatus Adlerbacteria bacterium RIFCSPLOWO2_01_FULL_51_16 TaxID=1797243 RepID=A0A1F4XGA0_9BACT|nr:MAG: hypothetical protein A2943_02395 [Candidatus Adlerbacteria bacterium RIFCSPLOWO2_01_FULL_51_16]
MQEDLLTSVKRAVAGMECEVLCLGPDSVAVMGDARFYGPSVIIKFHSGITAVREAEIATKITNDVEGISRVLAQVLP